MSPPVPNAAGQYNDRNPAAFLRLGGSRETSVIHRRIWAPGIATQEDAFLYLNRLVSGAIIPILKVAGDQPRVLDLGCEVGGTSTWIAGELNVKLVDMDPSTARIRS